MPQISTYKENTGRSPVPADFAKSFEVKDWVSSRVYWRGVGYFQEDRVLSLEVNDDLNIEAEVEGSEIYDVAVSWNDDGEPAAECTCPYDWEPLCKHAVAAILAWQAAADGDLPRKADAGLAARREEIVPDGDTTLIPEASFDRDAYLDDLAGIERKKRRSPKLLESLIILKAPKEICGVYTVSAASRREPYSVTVRDALEHRFTTCNCPDYLVNELGTCKHIELVKAGVEKLLKRRSRRKRTDSRVWISLMPKNTHGCSVNPFEEIHVHASDEGVRSRLFDGDGRKDRPWLASGYLRETFAAEKAVKKFNNVLAAVNGSFKSGGAPEIVVAPEVANLVAEMDDLAAWKKRVDSIIRAPKDSKEWVALKKGLAIKLYDYQEEGILFAVRNRRSFIGDDMGLGKTVQAIAAALLIKRLAGIKRVLVFCPASLKFQWKREIEKLSGEKAEIVQGGMKTRRDLYEKSRAMFLIVNYELIFRDEEFYHRMEPDMVILDEAQRIKNWETKTAKGMKRIASEFALILTGTPFENRLAELQSLCEFLHPRALGPMWRLLPAYGNMDENDRLVGFSNLSGLRLKLAPFFLRRDKDTVASQLPERVTNEYTVEISPVQAKYHDDYEYTLARILARAKRRPLTPDEIKRVFMCLTNMRIISNALAQHDWKKFQRVVDVPGPLDLSVIKTFHSPKLLEFRSVMEELIDRLHAKFVIFSQWERMLWLAEASIRDILMARGLETVIFSGSLATSARPKVIERFINDPKLRVFFSTDAGGVGLNLQESASYVINLEMPWNPAVLDQRIGRVHRLGQKNTVNVINFISTGCVEERVYGAVGNKRRLFEGLFDGKTESVEFENGSTFIERLKEMMGDAIEDAEKRDGLPDMEETLDVSEAEATPPAETAPATPPRETRGEVDLTGVLRTLGSWMGDGAMKDAPDGALKIGVEKLDGEIKFSLRRPSPELAAGLKNILSNLAGLLGG